MFNKQDIEDMRICGKVGKNLYPFHNLWFFLKDKILTNYGKFDGYDLQTWDDMEYSFNAIDPNNPEVFATHMHILKRYILQDGEWFHVFHIPTNEYDYWINGSNFINRSDGFNELYKLKKETIIGKKKYEYHQEYKTDAWNALKRLIGRYSYLVKNEPMPIYE
jgi:hypothetical protein